MTWNLKYVCSTGIEHEEKLVDGMHSMSEYKLACENNLIIGSRILQLSPGLGIIRAKRLSNTHLTETKRLCVCVCIY